MNLRLNAAIFIVGILIGGFMAKKMLKPELVTNTNTVTKTVRVIEPNGKITETIQTEEKTGQVELFIPKYGFGFYNDGFVHGEYKLGKLPKFIPIIGDLPLSLIGESNLKEHRVGVKLEF